MGIQHSFYARQVEMTDGSVLFEILGPDMTRIATCTDAEAAETLEMDLNMVLTDWLEGNQTDRVAA